MNILNVVASFPPNLPLLLPESVVAGGDVGCGGGLGFAGGCDSASRSSTVQSSLASAEGEIGGENLVVAAEIGEKYIFSCYC